MSGDDFDDDFDDEADFEEVSAVDWIAKQKRDQSHRNKPGTLKSVPWPVCPVCGGPPDDDRRDSAEQWQRVYDCSACDGIGHEDVPIDDETFGETVSGSDARVVMLAKRYAAGMPDLWSGDVARGMYRGTTFVTPEMDF